MATAARPGAARTHTTSHSPPPRLLCPRHHLSGSLHPPRAAARPLPRYIFTKVIALPEFDVQAAGSAPTPKFLECLFEQAGGMCVTETEHPYVHANHPTVPLASLAFLGGLGGWGTLLCFSPARTGASQLGAS